MLAAPTLALGVMAGSFALQRVEPSRPNPAAVCGSAIPAPVALPPSDSGAVVYQIVLCFGAQGGSSLIDAQTYLYYIHLQPSRPSQGAWTTYDEAAEQTIRDDFRRLWATGFLDNLSIEAMDYQFDNGVTGKLVVYNMEERQRVKIVDYAGSKLLETSKIDEKLTERHAEVRLDTFVDASLIRRVEGILREMMSAKGFEYAGVTHTIAELPGGPKLVHLTFHIDEGPLVQVRSIEFVGNREIGARRLKKQMKDTKARSWLPFLFGRGAYQQATFDDDAQRVVEFYQSLGYVRAQVGEPQVAVLGDSRDKKTRWVGLKIPVTEGPRYRVGSLDIAGNSVVGHDDLKSLFKLRSGDFYSIKTVREGLSKARELYGAGGYYEFTGFPDYKFSDEPASRSGEVPAAITAVAEQPSNGPPTVDVTIRLLEGAQYFINRINIVGNTTTHDSVIRRELRVAESGVFNTEALKYSIRRLNQLGYFKPIDEQKGITVEKTAGAANTLDVTLNLQEQNRNQVQFGAGVSQYEGLFGNISYTTANLLGRGESFNVTLQKGSRGNVYQIGVTEPFLFDRPIVTSAQLYSRKNDYYTTTTSPNTSKTVLGSVISSTAVSYSEVREGGSSSIGWPVGRFGRAYLNYTYEVIDVWIADALLASSASGSGTSANAAGTPLFNANLDTGRHADSRVAPTFVYNTVDNPITAHSGTRITAAVNLASQRLGGSYDYMKPDVEVVTYIPTSRRTGFGLRGQSGWLHTYGSTTAVPYYLRYFLGGEYQIRGVDIRTVGPLDSSSRALGGNKFLLFNAEYYVDLFGPVRLLAFHDAGQAFEEGHSFNLRELRTSSGGELRVMVPVLNVPFRLIYYVNVYRDTFQPARGLKFSVGTTF